ncbi:MAG TPA: MASE1 domain-containing protein [Vicinamibacterales bacterium]
MRGSGSAPARQTIPRLAAAASVALGYYLGAKLGFALTLAPIPVSTLWPPNAILLSGLLLTSTRAWPIVLLATFVAHLAVEFQTGVPTAMILCWFVSNSTEALIGAVLFRWLSGGAPTFETFRNTAVFLCAASAATFISSFLDAGLVVANGWGDADYWTIWRTRFFSNVVATITLVPVIVTSAQRLARRQAPPPRKVAEALLGFAVLAAICWVVFVQKQPGPHASPALLYGPVPLLIAAAVRFGPWGASVSILTCALFAIIGAVAGQGPFVSNSAMDNALSVQLFLIVAWLPIMSLAAVIRERVRADAAARASEEQLALAIDAAQLGRWEWEFASGRVTWSDITRRIYEVAPDVRITPEMFDALVHPDDRPLLAAAAADGLAGRAVDVEFRIRVPSGRVKWILSKGRTLYGADGRPARIVGIKVDITERRCAELQIQEQRQQLAQLSRVSVANEMSLTLAHEMNQPLAAILANASAARRLLLREPPDLGQLGEIVDAIAHDNRRAAAIIGRFGTLLRESDSRWALLAINDVVRRVVDVTRTDMISRGVSLSVVLASELPRISGDVFKLQQVLMNLIANACDAMESSGAAERRLQLRTELHSPGSVRVTLTDSGPGVPEHNRERIFEPFVTSKPQRLGLGLSICRSIISGHNGELWVEPDSREGATFCFSLPAAEQQADVVETRTTGTISRAGA